MDSGQPKTAAAFWWVRTLAALVAICAALACSATVEHGDEPVVLDTADAGAAGFGEGWTGPFQLEQVSVELPAARAARLDPQSQSLWCWAATIANLFAYEGHRVSQARIVEATYGEVTNIKSGPYSNLSALLHRDWIDDDGRAFSTRVVGSLDQMAGIQTLDNDAVREALEQDDPVIIATSSHVMLVVGMTFFGDGEHVREVRSVQVFDPWPRVGFRALTPAEQTPASEGGVLAYLARISVQSHDAPWAN